jgi:hypothetical protein
VTDESACDDTNALSTYLPDKIATSIRWKTNESILFGSGTGVPSGLYEQCNHRHRGKGNGTGDDKRSWLELGQDDFALAPCVVCQGGVDRQQRCLACPCSRSPWATTHHLPMGLNVGGIQVSPYGTLLGRPVFVSQHANSFSGAGDVLLADLSYYQTITKAGGLQTATSMHLYFDADLTAFRTTFRMDGQSKIAAPISPAKGSATMSPFVQLGAR